MFAPGILHAIRLRSIHLARCMALRMGAAETHGWKYLHLRQLAVLHRS